MTKNKNNWFVCHNRNGMFYVLKSKCQSIQEIWDREGFNINAIYGPCSKRDAREYANDMIEVYKDKIDYSKPTNTMIDAFSDDDNNPDDYAGLISPKE